MGNTLTNSLTFFKIMHRILCSVVFFKEAVKKEEKFTKLNIVESFAPPWFSWSPRAQSAVDIFINVGMIQGAYCFVANF